MACRRLRTRAGATTPHDIDPTDDCTFWYVNEYYYDSLDTDSPVRKLADAHWQLQVTRLQLAVTTRQAWSAQQLCQKCLGSSVPGDPKFLFDVMVSSAAPLLIDGAYDRLPLISLSIPFANGIATALCGNSPSSKT